MSLHGDRRYTLLFILVAFVGGTAIILLRSRTCCGLLIAYNLATAQLSDWRLVGEAHRNCARQQLLWVGLFLALALPYAAKDMTQGLSEWFAVASMVLYAALCLRRQYLPDCLCQLGPH